MMRFVMFTEGLGTGETFVREFDSVDAADAWAETHDCMCMDESQLVDSLHFQIEVKDDLEDRLRETNRKIRQIQRALDDIEKTKESELRVSKFFADQERSNKLRAELGLN